MKRAFLLKTIVAVFSVLFAVDAYAQNSNQDVMGIRLIVTGNNVSGIKRFTYSSSGTGTWGRKLDSTWQNVPLVAASPDFKACSTISSITGNSWVLIMRGDCEFGAKALAAEQHGAKGVIIVNNVSGAGPVGMGAGASGNSVTIPVLMIGNEDGLAIKAALDASNPVTISLTRWGFNYAHDLAIVPSSVAAMHDGSVPVAQTSSGSPALYRFYTGGFIANTGTQPTTNITLSQVTTWTPSGGTPTVVNTDTAKFAGPFNVSDSIIQMFTANSYSHNATQTGRYTTTYTVSSADADNNPSDNTMTTIMDVTPQVFCKGQMDGNQNPRASIYYSITNNPAFTWGPVFYVNKGGYKADKVKLLVSDNDTSKHSLSGAMNVYIFKWVDGSNGGATDNIIQSRELSLKSIAGRNFVAADSNSQPITINCADSNGLPGTVVLEDNSYYWLGVDVPAGWFLGCDGGSNYYNRVNAAQNFATNKVQTDFWGPLYPQSEGQLATSSTDTVKWIPFGVIPSFAHLIDSVPYSQVNGTVPAVAFFTGQFLESVKQTKSAGDQIMLYPNPAVNTINAKINLSNGQSVSGIRVIDAMGRNVYQDDNVRTGQGIITVATDKLAPGNYYLLFNTGATVLSRSFTVSSK